MRASSAAEGSGRASRLVGPPPMIVYVVCKTPFVTRVVVVVVVADDVSVLYGSSLSVQFTDGMLWYKRLTL